MSQDTIMPGLPKGYEHVMPLLIVKRQKGEFTEGFLKYLYPDGLYTEYTDVLIFFDENNNLIQKEVAADWYEIVTIDRTGIGLLTQLIRDHFKEEAYNTLHRSDCGEVVYFAVVDGKNYFWTDPWDESYADGVAGKIEYIINTHIKN